jgi:hypothetical protein
MTKWRSAFLILLLANSLAIAGRAVTKETPQVIWRRPAVVEKLDFVGGPEGRSRAPKPPFKFVEEDLDGTNPKIRVTDARGVTWRVKFGSEVNAEVFASRLAWAAGYFVEPMYFVESGSIRGVKGLTRAKKHVTADGMFTAASFKRKEKNPKVVKHKNWAWTNNPFLGHRELNGLKIIMMLTSNWDNKDTRDADSNVAIFEYSSRGRTELRYLVTDWGASMGKWGGFFAREKWDCQGYAAQTPDFIKDVKNGVVHWGFHGKHTDDFTHDISVSDVGWLLQYLGRITDRQIRTGLRASGANTEETECFANTIHARIDQMKHVARR